MRSSVLAGALGLASGVSDGSLAEATAFKLTRLYVAPAGLASASQSGRLFVDADVMFPDAAQSVLSFSLRTRLMLAPVVPPDAGVGAMVDSTLKALTGGRSGGGGEERGSNGRGNGTRQRGRRSDGPRPAKQQLLFVEPELKASFDEMVRIKGLRVPPLWIPVGAGVAVPVWRGLESFDVDGSGVDIAGRAGPK